MIEAQARLAGRLRWYAPRVAELGSSLYGFLLEETAKDVESGGPAWQVLHGHEDDARGSALALRLMGAVHRLVLEDRAPGLARHYPSMGGAGDRTETWTEFRKVLDEHRDDLRPLLDRTPQTNEVARSGALVGGFLTAAARTSLPLRIFEVGASAGLNLRWDHYRYEARGKSWGRPASPVRLCDFDAPPLPPFGVQTRVVERRGCDRNPVDPTTEEGRLTLLSYVWPDQLHRIRLLRSALEVAQAIPVTVDEANAPEWLKQHLTVRRDVTTVVYHSVFLQYPSASERAESVALIKEAGDEATESAPLAWLRMEPGEKGFEVRLTLWPGGKERLLATCGGHGNRVRWRD